ITPGFWNILKQFAPFGPGNRSPVFVSYNVVDSGASRLLTGNHLKLSVKQADSPVFQGIAFKQGEAFDWVKSKMPFHICYKIEENTWQGRSRLELIVKDIQFQ
ncbi:MAG: single-stranded-DNA-specific exonuclease RecJ, partial [Bacteroidetes bacterium]